MFTITYACLFVIDLFDVTKDQTDSVDIGKLYTYVLILYTIKQCLILCRNKVAYMIVYLASLFKKTQQTQS